MPPQVKTGELQIFGNTSAISSGMASLEIAMGNIQTEITRLRTFKQKLYSPKSPFTASNLGELQPIRNITESQIPVILKSISSLQVQAGQIQEKARRAGDNATAQQAQVLIDRLNELHNTLTFLRHTITNELKKAGIEIVGIRRETPFGFRIIGGNIQPAKLLDGVTESLRSYAKTQTSLNAILRDINNIQIQFQTVQEAKVKVFSKPGKITIMATIGGRPAGNVDIRIFRPGVGAITETLQNGEISLSISPPGEWRVTRVGNYRIESGGVAFTAQAPSVASRQTTASGTAVASIITLPERRKIGSEICLKLTDSQDNLIKQGTAVTILGPDGILKLRVGRFGQVVFTPTTAGDYRIASVEGYGKIKTVTYVAGKKPRISDTKLAFNISDAPTLASRGTVPRPRIPPSPARVDEVSGMVPARARKPVELQVTGSIKFLEDEGVISIQIEANQPIDLKGKKVRIRTPDGTYIEETIGRGNRVSFTPTIGGKYTIDSLPDYNINHDATMVPYTVLAGSRYDNERNLIVIHFSRKGEVFDVSGKKVTVLGPNNTTIQGRVDSHNNFSFTPQSGASYRLLSLEGHFPPPAPLRLPSQEVLAQRKDFELRRERYEIVQELKIRRSELWRTYPNNPALRVMASQAYNSDYSRLQRLKSHDEIVSFRPTSLDNASTLAQAINEKHNKALETITSLFGSDQSSGSTFWQLRGTASAGSGLYGVLYKVMKSGDLSLYDKFISFIRSYATVAKTLESKKDSLGDQYNDIQYQLATAYREAVRDISKFDQRRLVAIQERLPV
ncbi:hypothetical protein HY570_02255 [Candidatus Micrarchaeota archaeon]|nr:hypothetical protein [Candidatus Micrarchaeota archaeon]